MLFGKMFSDVDVSRHNGINSIKTVALVIQHAMRMRRFNIVICGLSGCPIFSPTVSHKRYVFRKNKFIGHKLMF
jgi:hypothetical protein